MGYDEVDDAEKIDLIRTLPAGSLYVSKVAPKRQWSEAQNNVADIIDVLWAFMHLYATGSTEGANKIMRPSELIERQEAAKATANVQSVSKRIKNTKWEAVEE